MSMYDTLYDDKIKCPYCGSHEPIEIQTKDLDCLMNKYVVYDPTVVRVWPNENYAYAPKLKYIEGIATCKSYLCQAYERMKDFVEMGYTSGFTRHWFMRYPVVNDKVSQPGAMVETDKATRDFMKLRQEFFDKLSQDKKAKKSFEKELGKCSNEFGIAILSWRYLK